MNKDQLSKKSYVFLLFFIFLYIFDGSISVIEELWTLFIDDNSAIFDIRKYLAVLTLFLCAPYVFVVFLSKIGEKYKYLAAPFYLVATGWFSIVIISILSRNMRPEEIFTMQTARHLSYQSNIILFLIPFAINIVQVVIGIVLLKKLHATFQNNRSDNEKSSSSIVRGCIAMGLIIFGAILYSLPQLLSIIVLVENSTKGYLTVKGSSIVSVQREFQKNGQVVKLIPMVHVGDKVFYRSLNKDFDYNKKTLFLLEGIRDKENLLNSFSHKRAADKIGVDTQSEHFNPSKGIKESNFKNIDFEIADVSSSDMDQETIKLLNESAKPLTIMDIIAPNEDIEDQRREANFLTNDLVIRRNKFLMKVFDDKSEKYEVIIIPWGALHIPYVEEELLKRNFVESDRTVSRIVFSLFQGKTE